MPTDTPVSTRLYLMAHAPPPPESWIAEQVDIQQWDVDKARADYQVAVDTASRLGEPDPPPRTPTPAPTAMDLDIQWRLAWADRALVMNSE